MVAPTHGRSDAGSSDEYVGRGLAPADIKLRRNGTPQAYRPVPLGRRARGVMSAVRYWEKKTAEDVSRFLIQSGLITPGQWASMVRAALRRVRSSLP